MNKNKIIFVINSIMIILITIVFIVSMFAGYTKHKGTCLYVLDYKMIRRAFGIL